MCNFKLMVNMMSVKFKIIALLLFSFISITYAQKKTKSNDDLVIIEVGNEKITAKELQKAYRKNLSRKSDNLFSLPKDSIMDFINLYTNFRLKVNDAISRGFEKDSIVLADLKNNRKILSESFFYDKKLTDPNVDYLLGIRKKEYQVGIILVTIKYNPQPDTLTAYNKIMDALNALKSGRSFEDVASQFSEDIETAKRGGKIPTYITSGKVQRPIEKAIFNTPKGSYYPEIVKTNFGYFIIKVYDIADRILVQGEQILIAPNENRDSTQAKKLADSLYNLIKKGAKFDELASKFSDDAMTARNGGKLGEFYSRSTGFEDNGNQLIPAFEGRLFELKDGEVSEPVLSEYGYHIIKRTASKQPDFEKERSELRKIYKRLYFEDDKTKLIDSLKQSYNFKIYEDVFEKLVSEVDTNYTTLKDNWDANISQSTLASDLYRIFDIKYNTEYFIDRLKNQPDLRGNSLSPNALKKAINHLVEPLVFERATQNLENEYPEFAELMKEFRDGILLFRVEALEVWDNLKFDSTKAKMFFDTLSRKFYTEEMYDITEVFVLSDSNAQNIYQRIKNGEDIKSIAQKETMRDGYREKLGHWGLVSPTKNELAQHAQLKKAKVGDVLEPFSNGNGFSIIKINDYQAPREKRFEEAITDIAPLYQEMLQKELTNNWLSKARKKFPVKINEKNINELIKKSK